MKFLDFSLTLVNLIFLMFGYMFKAKKNLYSSQVAHPAGAYPVFHSMKRLGAKPRSNLKRGITFDDSRLSFDKELVWFSLIRFSSAITGHGNEPPLF